ncbi:MAG: 4-hydroxy-tetrahydrodipicolinate synthase [Selenomonadaceae bacterium]
MKDLVFKGAGVALVTPFTDDGINFPELARLIEFNIANGTDAIVITATSGEAATMSDKEHKDAIKFAVEQVKGRIPVIAGTGSNDTAYAVQLSQYAEKAGADALLMVTPYYNKCTQQGLIKHFTYVADRVNIPIILYNVPSRTGLNIKPATYAELAKHPRIVATKEASGDISAILKVRQLCGDNLTIYSGNDDQIVALMSLGGKGVISVLSNVVPQYTHDMCQCFFDGKAEEAAKMQVDALDLIEALFVEVNPIPVKTALRLMGYQVGPLRLPLCDMEAANLEQLSIIMRKHGLLK